MSGWRAMVRATSAEHACFTACLERPMAAQAAQLRQIMAAHKDSQIGRRYGFASLADPDRFRARVPAHSPEDLQGTLGRAAAGDGAALCGKPVVAYERTAGSTSGGRLVPYTAEGLTAFRRAIYPWLHDLLARRPRIMCGRVYWAVSPVGGADAGPLAAGGPSRADDSDYFGPDLAPLLESRSAAPACLARIRDVETWRYLLLRHLLAADDLSLVSVWSPTFLTGLLGGLETHRERLMHDVARGTVSWPSPGISGYADRFGPRPDRAAILRSALSEDPMDLARVWPSLDTLSCWTHGSAARFLPEVAETLPQAWIQGKGLLATEAAITLPLADHPWPVLAVNSGFFEFVDARGESRLCEELETGAAYSLRITTHSGLYRYEIGDRVRVRGHVRRTPMLEFVGRGGLVSDLVGEKLADDFVEGALGVSPGFAMLAPLLEPSPRYALFLDADTDADDARSRAGRVDARLAQNPHYLYARRLGQLAGVTPIRVPDLQRRYQDSCLARGQRLSDIKPPALRPESDWIERLGLATPEPGRATGIRRVAAAEGGA